MKRFWSKVDIKGPDECWTWTANTHRQGYGFFKFTKAQNRLAHRVAYELAYGVPLVPAQKILHKCDNPCCVNPVHLMLGTQRDNVLDMIAKGRDRRVSKITDEQVTAIRLDARTQQAIADDYGIHYSEVSRIKRGLKRRRVPMPDQNQSGVTLPRSL